MRKKNEATGRWESPLLEKDRIKEEQEVKLKRALWECDRTNILGVSFCGIVCILGGLVLWWKCG